MNVTVTAEFGEEMREHDFGFYVPTLFPIEEPWWDDRPCIIVGAGTSLKGFDHRRLDGLGYVIAVNGAMHDHPGAAAWFTLDLPFLRNNVGWLRPWRDTPLIIAVPPSTTQGPDAYKRAATLHSHHHAPHIKRARYIIRQRINDVLTTTLDRIEGGTTSGFAAMNYAWTKSRQMQPIFLFGFDYRVGTRANGAGETVNEPHYCPDRYPEHTQGHNERYWVKWARCFDRVRPQADAAGVRIINCVGEPRSAIECLETVTIDEGVRMLEALRADREQALARAVAGA